MTTIDIWSTRQLCCAVCGVTREAQAQMPNYHGRRTDPEGFDLPVYSKALETCHSCGYVAPDLNKKPLHPEVIKSAAYQQILKNRLLNDGTKEMLCHALLMESAEEYVAAAWAMIQLAHLSDDSIPQQMTHDYLLKSLDLIEQAHQHGQLMTEESGLDTLLKVELHRRIGEFEKAKDLAGKALVEIQDECFHDIIRHQMHLIEQHISERRTFRDDPSFPENMRRMDI